MSSAVFTKTYAEPPVCEKEILRYAGCKQPDGDITAVMQTCLAEVRSKLRYAVCYRELPVTIEGARCDFGAFSLQSRLLAKNLSGCSRVLVFAATIGVEIDRLIARYGRIAPSKALLLQAIGAERIEALCDAFCTDMAKEKGTVLRPRFSPGYGDLPLKAQKELFAVLDCAKHIGLSLNGSLLMSPSKSVTAFAGLGVGEASQSICPCEYCDNKDCSFRGTP